jgi:two-component system sensor histidine kinase CpxA
MKSSFPLSTRILLLAIGNVALLSLLFVFFLRLQLREDFGYFLMTAGRDRMRAIAQQLSVQLQDVDRSKWDSMLQAHSAANGVTFLIYDVNGQQLAGPRLTLPAAVQMRLRPRTNPRTGISSWVPPFIVITDAEIPYWIGVWMPIGQEVTKPDQASRTVLVLASPALITNPFFFHATPWLGMAVLAFIVTLVWWLPLVRSLTCSIRQMMHATAEIAEGHFNTPVASRRTDELGKLSASIRQMAARLEMFTRAHKRFLGDVAHELRSPIARMQVALGILERKLSEEDSCLADLKEDVSMMSALTDELLTFARATLIPKERSLEPTRLMDIVHRAVKSEVHDRTTVRVQIDPAIQVQAQPEYLFRSLSNVVRNAVRYAGDQGAITISAEADGEYVMTTVADLGPGIPDEALDKIFTPFYRLEESRDRGSGGTGLGLAIVQACVQACHGSVTCRNRKPRGLEVTITLQAA